MHRNYQFKTPDGKTFEWEGTGGRLKLKDVEEPDSVLAIFHCEQRYMSFLRMKQHPYLEIQPAAMNYLDFIIRKLFSLIADAH